MGIYGGLVVIIIIQSANNVPLEYHITKSTEKCGAVKVVKAWKITIAYRRMMISR